ncbi:hypothetical protein SHKM778_31410 [Streptomyces sp. KM77-8]|uniref:Uncharacterized protein n=1 Tax=Streptomyces haneummycinicus TaxID=3074435 RepID=A0AAT9HHB1_9ACTN
MDGTVHVHGEGVEPDDPPGLHGIDGEVAGDLGGEVPRARQIVHAEIDSGAGGVQFPHLLVRLTVRDRRIEVHQHQLGEPQSQRPRQLPTITSATSAFRPCADPVNLTT